jgi:TPR repeat protein
MMMLTDKFENNVKTSYSGYKYLKTVVQPSPMEGFDAARYAFVKVDKQVNAPGINATHHLNIIVNTETMKVSSTTSGDYEDPQGIYLQALELYNNKAYKKAIPLFEKVSVLQRFPGRFRAKTMLGWIYLDQEKFDKANELLRESSAEDPLGKVLLASKIMLSKDVPVLLRNTTEGIQMLRALGNVRDKEIPQMHLIAKTALVDASMDWILDNPIITLPAKEKEQLANDLILDPQSSDIFQIKGYIAKVNYYNPKNPNDLKEAYKDMQKAETLLQRAKLSKKTRGELDAQLTLTTGEVLYKAGDKAGGDRLWEKAMANPYALPTIAMLKLKNKKVNCAAVLDLYQRSAANGDPFSTYIVSLSHYPQQEEFRGICEKTFVIELPNAMDIWNQRGWGDFAFYLLQNSGQTKSFEEFKKWNQKAIDLGNINALADRALFEAANAEPFKNVSIATALQHACQAAVVSKVNGVKLIMTKYIALNREKKAQPNIPFEQTQTCKTLKALDEQGNGAAAYLLFAEYSYANNEDLAVYYLERSKDAGYYTGLLDYANYMIDLKNYDQAMQLFNKLTVYPYSGAYYFMGHIEELRNNYQGARKYYEMGMKFDGGEFRCYEAMSDMLKNGLGCNRNLKAAKEYIDKAVFAFGVKRPYANKADKDFKRLTDKQEELEKLVGTGTNANRNSNVNRNNNSSGSVLERFNRRTP